MKQIELVYNTLLKEFYNSNKKGISAEEISNKLNIQRSNVSAYLNKLFRENKLEKIHRG